LINQHHSTTDILMVGVCKFDNGLKTNQTVTYSNIEDTRLKADKISNGILVVKDNYYSIVNYKIYTQLTQLGYNQVR
jgi:hypothetical protein